MCWQQIACWPGPEAAGKNRTKTACCARGSSQRRDDSSVRLELEGLGATKVFKTPDRSSMNLKGTSFAVKMVEKRILEGMAIRTMS